MKIRSGFVSNSSSSSFVVYTQHFTEEQKESLVKALEELADDEDSELGFEEEGDFILGSIETGRNRNLVKIFNNIGCANSMWAVAEV